jgi:hypothetical protein
MSENASSFTPEIFRPVVLRNGEIYRNLSQVEISNSEKDWLCRYLDKHKDNLTYVELAQRYQINASSLRNWYYRNFKPHKAMHSSVGKPSYFADTVKETIQDFVHKGFLDKSAPFPNSLKEVVVDAINDKFTKENSGRTLVSLNTPTYNKILKQSGITNVLPQTITQARRDAASDIRMTYSLYVMCLAFTANLPPQMIFNWDFTQFAITSPRTGSVVCCLEEDLKTNMAATANIESDTAIFMKWLFFANASGDAGPLVLSVAIDEMDPDEFEVIKVAGLTYKACMEYGYIFFTKTRAGNRKSFSFFIKDIVCQEVVSTRDFYNLKVCACCVSYSFFLLIFIE